MESKVHPRAYGFIFANSIPALSLPRFETSLLASANTTWIPIVIVTAWQTVPSAMLIQTAGILAMPADIYEAADIDGASKLQQLFRMTLPLVAGYVVINVILGFKGFLNAYDIIVGLTGGGPGTSTRSIAISIVAGFNAGDYAYQMANTALFFVVAILISLLQLRLTRGKSVL